MSDTSSVAIYGYDIKVFPCIWIGYPHRFVNRQVWEVPDREGYLLNTRFAASLRSFFCFATQVLDSGKTCVIRALCALCAAHFRLTTHGILKNLDPRVKFIQSN